MYNLLKKLIFQIRTNWILILILLFLQCHSKNECISERNDIKRIIIYSVFEDFDWLIPVTKKRINELASCDGDTIIETKSLAQFSKIYDKLTCSEQKINTDDINILAMIIIQFNKKTSDTLLIEWTKKSFFINGMQCYFNQEMFHFFLPYFCNTKDVLHQE